ncbi:crotonobetainyl-CoA:carnitine CoA-transferase CaiB-like acyl-CoA transferase [Novosphingobium chloroacetimidivorans]|uniref:Crotonobetainyl-CoA:carnitine CoA-transferase CaiB-like acyl-CoA transferase n=1 Tax=Novosphingobium chloroacetimidivorans TaxID=1428314 RepID=A0A7W7NWP3_9SPHN|nr:CoA transferase [Novosphingobium chloroacetimidivorans]MBB4858365.1 crotonobetainyl-CoA:carnitine CoA-transferase CaiB-like acyl-CoA transferase [Novosphingobium chloroacetimidivorans]
MTAPLSDLSIVVRASGVAAAYAARLLGTMGGKVLLAEPEGGTPLRREPPFLPCEDGQAGATSALFAYLAAGMDSEVVADAARLSQLLTDADVFIDDTPVAERERLGLDEAAIAGRYPQLIHVSVLPFGASGPKCGWKGEDVVIQHAGGEGNLLPNGLAVEMFPDRAPLKIAGHFGAMQGGIAAALGALAALWDRPARGGQFVDISCQDANLAVGAFAIQRLGDGSIEHRVERSFRYGGVIPCEDGYLELLTLEQRQWDGLVKLLGNPAWALDPALADSLERSRRGPEINEHIRAWAAVRKVDDIVSAGQTLGVPLARYKTPAQILADPQERHRGVFQKLPVGDAGELDVLVSPFHFDAAPLTLAGGPPPLKDMPVLARAKG